MSRIVIVADDLTGAADAAAPLARVAETVLVLDTHSDVPVVPVVAVDTDTRGAEPGAARAVVREAVRRAQAAGCLVYKKIDSTLRGNVSAEIAAAAAALGSSGRPAVALVAPAFPALGRTVVDGVVLVDGLPLRGPYGGYLPDLLAAGGLTSRVVRADDSLPAAIVEAYPARVAALVVDATTDRELATVFAAAQAAPERVLLVGSGGLARHYRTVLPARTPPRLPGVTGPALVVHGSWSERGRAQAAALEEMGAVRVVPGRGASTRIAAVLAGGGVALLRPDPGAPVDPRRTGTVAADVARTAAPVLDAAALVVATGGDTARALLLAAGVHRLHVGGEVEPGIVWSRVPGRPFVVVTKAGAFGDEDVLVRTITKLTGRHHP